MLAEIFAFIYLVIFLGFTWRLGKKSKGPPIAEVGFIFASWSFLYFIVPFSLITFFGALNRPDIDGRMAMIGFDHELMDQVAGMNLAFGASFMAAYYWMVRDKEFSSLSLARMGTSQQRSTRGSYIYPALIIFFFSASAAFLIDLFFAAESMTYEETYVRYRHLPLIAQQVFPVIQAWSTVSAIVFCVVIYWAHSAKRTRFSFFILCAAIIATIASESRSGLLLVGISLILSVHIFARALSWPVVSAVTVSAFIFMLWFGTSRAGTDHWGFLSQNEFSAVFTTQYHIASEVRSGRHIEASWQVYVSDLTAVIPQQLFPFDKQDPSSWYMEQYFPVIKEGGQGFSFGVISEAFIGNGVLDAILRGLALGLVLSVIRNRFYGRKESIYWACTYIYLCATVYLAYRATTFAQFRLVLFNLVPLLILLFMARKMRLLFITRQRFSPSHEEGKREGTGQIEPVGKQA